MSVNNASVISLFMDGTKVAVATTHELSFEKETIETTNKDSGGWAEFISGKKSVTVSVEGFVDPDAQQNFDGLYTLFEQDASFTWKYTDEVVGNKRYEGSAIFTSLSRSGGTEEAETFSGEIQVTGQPSPVAIT